MGKSALAQLTEGFQGDCQGAVFAQLALKCLYSRSTVVKFRFAPGLNMTVCFHLASSVCPSHLIILGVTGHEFSS